MVPSIALIKTRARSMNNNGVKRYLNRMGIYIIPPIKRVKNRIVVQSIAIVMLSEVPMNSIHSWDLNRKTRKTLVVLVISSHSVIECPTTSVINRRC